MSPTDVNRIIASVRMTNHFLGLVDKYRGNDQIKLSDVLEEFAEPYKPAGYSITNDAFLSQHQLISSLLVYIVLPKEKFWNKLPNIKISKLHDRWGFSHMDETWDLKYFLIKMRNAIAHGHIDVSENLEFSFRDKTFSVTLDAQSIQNFVQALAYWSLTQDVNLEGL